MKWRGSAQLGRKGGWAQFEENGPEIYFQSFIEFRYICRLLERSRKEHRLGGKRDALVALRQYEEGQI